MKRASILLFLAFATSAFAQSPDAPSSTPAYLRGDTEVHNVFDGSNPKNETRHPKYLLALAGAVAFEQFSAIRDTQITLRGIKAGVAVEGNSWLVGQRPSFRALEGRDLMYLGLTATPSVLAYVFRKPTLFFAGLTGPVAFGVKHLAAVKQWQALLDGAKPTGSELQ